MSPINGSIFGFFQQNRYSLIFWPGPDHWRNICTLSNDVNFRSYLFDHLYGLKAIHGWHFAPISTNCNLGVVFTISTASCPFTAKNRLPLIGTACFDYGQQILVNRDNIRVSIRITGNKTSDLTAPSNSKPATCGAAIEVPERVAYPPPL